MATTIARLQAIITANTAQFEAAMAKSETRMRKTGRIAGLAGLAIAGGLAYGIDKSVKAAEAAQISQAKLDVAFKTAGLRAKFYGRQVEDLTKKGRKLGFTDDQQRDALGNLLVATHNYTKAAKDLGIVEDIARFRHLQLGVASKTLTMAMAGSQRAIKQLGLTVQATTQNQDKAREVYKKQKEALDALYGPTSKQTKAEHERYLQQKNTLDLNYQAAKADAKVRDRNITAARVIELVSKKLHGQADAYSKTAAGAAATFGAELQHLEEQLGKALLPALTSVATALAGIATVMSDHTSTVKVFGLAVAGLATALLLTSAYAKLAGSALVTKFIPALVSSTGAMLGFDAAADANPLGAVIVLAFGLAAALTYLQVKYQGITKAVDFFKKHTELLLAVPLVGWAAFVAAEMVKHWNTVKTVAGAAVDSFRSFVQNLKKAYDELRTAVVAVKDALNFAKQTKPVQAAFAVIQGVVASLRIEFHTLWVIFSKVIDGFKWVIDHAKSIASTFGSILGGVSSLGHKLNPFGDGLGQLKRSGGGGSGAAEGRAFHVGRQLWDEIGMGERDGLRVTSGYRAGAITKHGTKSDHSYFPSRAVDMAGPPGGMATFFKSLIGRREIAQAFYDPLGSIFNGAWSSYREGGHSDHVHVAEYDRGGWLRPGWNLAYNGLGRPEPVGGGNIIIPVSIGGENVATVIFDQMQQKAKVFTRRNNGRNALPGG